MSHEIYETNGKQSIAYVGKTPWHGLGQKLTEDADIETWIEEAGLNWYAEEKDIFFNIDAIENSFVDTIQQKYPGQKALIRSDNQQPISIVSDKYNVVQPKEIIEFFRDLVETNDFNLHTAGSLREGKTIWTLADIKESFTLENNDMVNGYLLLATSLDRMLATTAQFTSVRVVCNNTLSLATSNNKNAVKIPHSRKFNADSMKERLGISKDVFSKFEEKANKMRSTNVTQKQAFKYLSKIFCPELEQDEITESQLKSCTKRMTKAMDIYENAPGQKEAGETAWGLVNTVTYFTDHEKNERKVGSRLNSAWFGAQAQQKQSALELAIEATENIGILDQVIEASSKKNYLLDEIIENTINQ